MAKKNKLDEKITELESQLKHALADYHNLSKRIKQKQHSWRDRAAARLVDKMLDVYDDLARAKKNLKDKGLSMTVNQFWAVLESEGVEKIEVDDQEFDADHMDCVKIVNGQKNKVMETIQSGYMLNGEVIRPAKVKVGKGNNE